jgi:O-antigen/teichoic acid export membrane protein
MFTYLSQVKTIFLNNWKNKQLLAQLFNVFFGLITGKIIAEKISPEGFGKYNLEFGYATFFYSLFIGPFVQYCKLYFKRIINNFGYIYLFQLGFILVVLTTLLFNLCYSWIFNDYSFFLIIFGSLSYFVLTMVSSIISDFYNLNRMGDQYFNFTFIKGFVGLVFLFIFLQYRLKIDEHLVLWGFQISSLFISVFFIFNIFKNAFYRKRILSVIVILKHYSKYSWPLLVLAFWNWIANFMDKVVIDYYLSESFVGFYNANSSLGGKFFLFMYPFFLLKLSPEIYNVESNNLIKAKVIQYIKMYILIGLLMLFFVISFQNQIGLILLSNKYSGYFSIISLSGIGFFIFTLTFFYETIFFIKRKLKYILYSTILSASAGVVLNLLLIPIFSIYGAVYSFIIGSTIKLIYINFKFRQI